MTAVYRNTGIKQGWFDSVTGQWLGETRPAEVSPQSDPELPQPQSPITNTVASPPPPQMAADYASYWKDSKVGSYTDFAGGVLYRYSNTEAVFIAKNGKENTIRFDSNLDDIASIVPDIAEVWEEQYGYKPQNPQLGKVIVSSDNWNPIYQSYSSFYRDRFATDKDVAFDKEIRNINLAGLTPNQAWEKIAIELYNGKDMTIEDIGRIENATGAVGRYNVNSNGTYSLPAEAFIDIAAVSELNLPIPQTVAVELPGNSDFGQFQSGRFYYVQPTSEVARFIQWQSAQKDSTGTQTNGSLWTSQGISNPYADPTIVQNAIEQVARTTASGIKGIWNTPDWPQYQSTNKQSYELAVSALANPSVRNKLIAENNWSVADFESWALKITRPTEAARQDALTAAGAGIITGADGSLTQLSSNGKTAVTTRTSASGAVAARYAAAVAAAAAVNAKDSGVPEATISETTGEDMDVFYFQPDPVDATTDPFEASRLEAQQRFDETAENFQPDPVLPSQTGYTGTPYDDDNNLNPGWTLDEFNNPVFVGGDFVEPATVASAEASRTQALKLNAQQQNTLKNRVSSPSSADWRVRLSLAQSATYLYRDSNNGILAPLARTNGVVFPYTPSIEMSYQAKYDGVDLTHSNYRGYFYRSSSVDQISIRGTFTAQDTREAEYLLAVITFFKAVTKMFYGATDPLAGTPPPLVFLSGFGQYQFSNHPCVVSNFQYSLPSDVDYIRANGFNNYGINLDNRRQQGSGPAGTGILGAISQVNRLLNNKLVQGALGTKGTPGPVTQNNSNTAATNSTYVPTKMEINLTLLPVQTRSQISTQFDVQKFANGSLLQQGFW